jgi:CspA family cold shock protein
VGKRTTGVVRWFDGSKGYGYIDAADGEDVFVHHSELAKVNIPLLLAGDKVTFFLEDNVRGLHATDVTYLN